MRTWLKDSDGFVGDATLEEEGCRSKILRNGSQTFLAAWQVLRLRGLFA